MTKDDSDLCAIAFTLECDGETSVANPKPQRVKPKLSPHARSMPADLHLSERHVTLRNDLVAASHGLKTLAEQRVVKSCAAKLDSVRLDQGRYKITLSAAEYAETFRVDPNTAYEQLKVVSKSLLDRMIRREEQTKRGLKVHLDHWVSGITYHEGEAWIELLPGSKAVLVAAVRLQLSSNDGCKDDSSRIARTVNRPQRPMNRHQLWQVQ